MVTFFLALRKQIAAIAQALFSPVVNRLLKALAIDIDQFGAAYNQKLLESLAVTGDFFDTTLKRTGLSAEIRSLEALPVRQAERKYEEH